MLRPLRSTGVTPLPRYYEPVRLPTAAAHRVMSSPVALGFTARRAGSPRFLGRSVRTRRPLSPWKARWVLTPVVSPPAAGFTLLGRLAAFVWCNEAESGSLALRLTRSLPGASPSGSLHLSSGSLPVERAIDRATSFQVTRSARLRLAHPRPPRSPRRHRLVQACQGVATGDFHPLTPHPDPLPGALGERSPCPLSRWRESCLTD